MIYENHVREVAEDIARGHWDKELSIFYKESYYTGWLVQHIQYFDSIARTSVRRESEQVRAALEINGLTRDDIDRYLIERGLVPAPECNASGPCEEHGLISLNGIIVCARCKKPFNTKK